MAKLTDAAVRKLKHRGGKHEDRHCDEHGLILRVQPTGGKSWMQRLTLCGKRIGIGLGGYPVVTVKEARETALENRRMARQGVDPRKARTTAPRFRTLAEAVIKINESTWAGGAEGKSARQWRSSLGDYAYPVLGDMPVDAIATADVLRVLTKPCGDKETLWSAQARNREQGSPTD